MTTRRWMIAVAVVGLICAVSVFLKERRERFARIAWRHVHAVELSHLVHGGPAAPQFLLRKKRVMVWHKEMARKYEYAARYPWLPVEPDPPEP
jgi:hypothetical protein